MKLRQASVLFPIFLAAAAILSQTCRAQLPAGSANSSGKGDSAKTGNFARISQAANAAREAGHDEEAIQLYQSALKLQPSWQEGMWYLSTLLYDKEDFPGSRDLLRRFVAEAPQAGPGWALLGLSEYQTRQYTRALEHLQRAMSLGLGERKDLTQSVLYFIALLLDRFEQYDDGANTIIAMAKASGHSDLLVEPLGLATLHLPFLPQEVPIDRKELVRDAGQAAFAVESQQPEEAQRLFDGMLAAYPDEPGVHFLYGGFLMDLRPEEGIRQMQRELEISPSHMGARLRLAEEYVKGGRMDEALPLAEEAVKLESENALANMILGEVLVAKRNLPAGIVELEKARTLTPGRVRIHWDLLRAYASAGRTEDAKREKDEIESLNDRTPQPQ